MAQAEDLHAFLADRESLLVVCHDNPDPDCLASAMALESLAMAAGVQRSDIGFGGEVSHQQNRALVDRLDIRVTPIESIEPEHYGAVAFVDHSHPTRNVDAGKLHPDIVIDHHPGPSIEAPVVDIRPDYGATATIFIEYFTTLDLDLGERLATALLFALHRERLDFVRSPTLREYRAALTVFPAANVRILEALYASAFSTTTVDAIGHAISSRHQRGSCLVACAGETSEPDALPQAATYLLNVEGIDTTLVYGLIDGKVRMSARTIDPGIHVGRILEEAFGEYGSFGGHHDMAGGWIDLGLYSTGLPDEDRLLSVVQEGVAERFFETIGLTSADPA